MKYFILLLVLLSPFALAHGTAEEHAQETNEYSPSEDFGPLGGPNDMSRLLPWTYAQRGDYTMTVVISLLWLVTIGGIGRLLMLVLGRLME